MNKKELHWESVISKCPHCGVPLSIHHVSTVSERHLVGMLYQSLNDHHGDCINHELPKSIDFEVETQSQIGSYGKMHSYKKMKLIF